YLSAAARNDVTVALTGDGGDESFAGYSRHQGSVLGAIVRRFLPEAAIDSYARHAQNHYAQDGAGYWSSFGRFIRYASRDPLLSHSKTGFWSDVQLRRLYA